MLIFSKHNIFSKIKGSDKHFIVNLLNGNADILSSHEAEAVQQLKLNVNLNSPLMTELIEKGYFIDDDSETAIYKKKYLDFIDSRDNDELQLFFVSNYSCNFNCSYCYQKQYPNNQKAIADNIIDAFFDYIKISFPNRKKYLTLFGGEPLLLGDNHFKSVKHFVNRAADNNLDLCVVTNGYYLSEYLETLMKATIREVQVTLDGTEEVHNSRRFLKGGGKTFEKIIKGIDDCLDNNIAVNLRMVIDKENIENLPYLAKFAINKGWTKNNLFKTQIGRNYELHHCQSAPDKLFSRISMYEKIHEISKKNPEILEFYKPAYSVAKFLFENSELPEPLFDSCPACKSEWAFDFNGNIYSCTATVGKKDEVLGTFFPDINLNYHKINDWQNRDVTSIRQCLDCNLQLACGGGCASVAKNNSDCTIAPDCRPVKELLEIGFAAYGSE